jgi:hypothetical protein
MDMDTETAITHEFLVGEQVAFRFDGTWHTGQIVAAKLFEDEVVYSIDTLTAHFTYVPANRIKR